MKKFLSCLMALVMIASMPTTAMALGFQNQNMYTEVESMMEACDLEQEIQKAELGVSEVELTEDYLEMVDAAVITSEGKELEIVPQVTVSKIGTLSRAAGSGDVYLMTAVASYTDIEEEDSDEDISMKATAYMVWRDYLGTENQLMLIGGNWRVKTSTSDNPFYIKKVRSEYGVIGGNTFKRDALQTEIKNGAFNANKEYQNIVGLKLYHTLYVTESSDITLKMNAVSSILST